MSETLEDLLRQVCERGCTHLTLWPVPSADGKKTYWHAQATPSTMHKYVSANDLDPVVALRGVLLGMPKAPKRGAPKKSLAGPELGREPTPDQTEITAAVTAAAQEDPQSQPQPPETLDTWLPRT